MFRKKLLLDMQNNAKWLVDIVKMNVCWERHSGSVDVFWWTLPQIKYDFQRAEIFFL